MPQAVVVGSGMSGLAVARECVKCGFFVTVVYHRSSPNLTSDVAGGIIQFPLVSGGISGEETHTNPQALVENQETKWGRRSQAAWREIAAQNPHCGVQETPVLMCYRNRFPDPPYVADLRNYEHNGKELLKQHGIGPGFVDAIKYTVPMVETTKYMTFLKAQLQGLGVRFIPNVEVKSLPELVVSQKLSRGDVIVNCTGINGARVAKDDKQTMKAVLGHVIHRVPISFAHPDWKPVPPLSVVDIENFTYILPKPSGNAIVLGGTKIQDDGIPTLTEELIAEQRKDVVKRCLDLLPHLKQETVPHEYRSVIGFRPARESGPRCELGSVTAEGVAILHNYGHSGDGITLAWGCAEHIAGLASTHSVAQSKAKL
eukprot:TRINITY_DN67821_c5_g7_i2.p1 TRINITY_DN67821_c5_g7~~TRINITY_DN67821_c5_g7_i2.p1  ORF type:complete len:371 (-),score=8.40 TRINITY_DN67821_c5_g7_i2:1023-2135(-)